MLQTQQEFFSPPQIAKLLGTDAFKIIRFIANGELRAIDVSLHRGKRPRWRISKNDLEAFLARRSTTPEPKRRTRRAARDVGVIEFYSTK